MSSLTVDVFRTQLQTFGFYDYVTSLLMLLSCALIGIYFGFIEKKSKLFSDEADYLVGGRKMKVFPISLSLIASFLSGITLLGTPTEIYLFGMQYTYIVLAVFMTGFAMMYIFMPVFHDMKLTSTYQYLNTRFDHRVRIFGSCIFILSTVVYLPIVCYVPALAFNQVTGINLHYVTPFVLLTCIFYTCVGGIKAVVWTDVVQSILMLIAMIIVVIKGTIDVGGFQTVINRALESQRLEFPDTTFDLRTRHTIWSMWIGGFMFWMKNNAISQNMVQRYLSLPTLKDANKALWNFCIGVSIFILLGSYCGLLIYARYFDCDPLKTKLVSRKDQLLPLFVMDILGHWPGLAGFFVAGVFSAALSTLSTGLNSLCAVILEDFFKPFSKSPLKPRQIKIITRSVVLIIGLMCVGLTYLVEKLGTVLQLSMSLSSVFHGPLLGLFSIGVMIPVVHGTGALVGAITSLIVMVTICFKAQIAIATGELTFDKKPLSTAGCSYDYSTMSPLNILNSTSPVADSLVSSTHPDDYQIYHISYLWYTFFGAVITVVISLLVSYLTGFNRVSDMDPKLLAPFMRKYIKPSKVHFANNQVKNVTILSLDIKKPEERY